MKAKNLKPMIISALLAVGFGASTVGTSFALFTDSAETNINVTAGKVDINATLRDVVTYSAEADSQGTLVDENNNKYVHVEQAPTIVGGVVTKYNFVNGGYATITDNVLDLVNITPGDKINFGFDLSNTSNVSFKYRFYYKVLEENFDLSKGLETSLKVGSGEWTKYVGLEEYRSTWQLQEATATLENLDFSIELPINAGNVYQAKNAKILIAFEAVQGNAFTTDAGLVKTTEVTQQTFDDLVNKAVADGENDTVVSAASPDNQVAITTTIPAAAQEVANNDTVTLSVTEVSTNEVSATNTLTIDFDVTLKVNETVTTSFSEPIKIELYIGPNRDIASITHHATTGDIAITDYVYDPVTGVVTFYSTSFSPFTVEYYELPDPDVYPVRIGKVGYETLGAAINAAVNGDRIIFEDDIQTTSSARFNINKDITIDLNKHSFLHYGSTTVKNGYSLAVVNGSAAFQRMIATDTNSAVTLSDLTLNLYAGNLFQIYGKTDIDILVRNSTITSAYTYDGNNNACLLSINGGTIDHIHADFRNSTINWNKDAWVKWHANAAEKDIYVTFDETTLGNNANSRVNYTSAEVRNVRRTNLTGGVVKYDTVATGDWLALAEALETAPEGYVVDGDNINISSAMGLAYFARMSVNDNFAGKTVNLLADIDLAFNKWTPIAKLTGGFAGTFNGNGHTIKTLDNKDALLESNNTKFGNGLFFRLASGATVQNLILDDFNLAYTTSRRYRAVGPLSGYVAGNATITNVHTTNSFVLGDMRIGGIIGMTEDPNSTITFANCSVEDTVLEAYCNAGGFIGTMLGEAVIDEYCYVKGITYEEVYSSGCEYVTLDTTVEDESSKYVANGTAVKGLYNNYDGDEYWYGAYADFYIDYGGSDCDPWLAGQEYRLCNSEMTINASRNVDGKLYL